MRVLQVIPSIASTAGGPVRTLLAECRAVHDSDTNIKTVVCTTESELSSRWQERLVQEMPSAMELRTFAATGEGPFVLSPSLLWWMWRNIEEFDLVVLRKMFNIVCSSAAFIARKRRVPYMVTPAGTLSRYTFRYRRTLLKKGYFRVVEHRTVESASLVRFTTEKERTEAPFSSGSTRTCVVPYPYYTNGSEGAKRRKSRKDREILFLSRFHPVKGIDVLLKAFEQILLELPKARLVLAGAGSARVEEEVRQSISRLGLEAAVSLPGFVEGQRKERLLVESTVFCLPSEHENYGLAVVEAMAAGMPVVISRGVGIWQDIEARAAGVVVKERTADRVAAGLLTLLSDEELRRKMGRNGQELVRSAFDPAAVGANLRQLYHLAAKGEGHDTET